MLVAFWDQVTGNSTPRCSKAGLSGSPITASRISHSIWSKGCTPGVEKRRSTERPLRPFLGLEMAVWDIKLLLSQRLSGVTPQDRSQAGRKKSQKAQIGVSEAAGFFFQLCQLPNIGTKFRVACAYGRGAAQECGADGGTSQCRARGDGRARHRRQRGD